jgi:hypothetical protein
MLQTTALTVQMADKKIATGGTMQKFRHDFSEPSLNMCKTAEKFNGGFQSVRGEYFNAKGL